MDVVFRVERNVKVEHGRHVFDVKTTRCHIGAHQQINLALLEGLKRFQSLVLALVAMQCGGLQTLALQRAGQARAAEFAVDENKRLLHAALFQDLMQGVAFVVIAHTVKMLLDGAGGCVGAGHLDRYRVLQVAIRKALDLGRERG